MWERYNLAGQHCMSRGNWTEAETQFKLAIQEAEKLGKNDPKLPISLQNLANCYRQQGRYEQAEPLYSRAIEVKGQQVGPLHKEMVPFLENYAKMLQAKGDDKQAKKFYDRAQAIFRN